MRDLGRPIVARVYFDENLAAPGIDAAFVRALPVSDDAAADAGKGLLGEFTHRMIFAGRQHVIARRRLLQHQPHALDIIARMAPVAPGVEIAEIELGLLLQFDRGHGAADLARDEGLAARRPFVVEQDAVRSVHAVGSR